MKYFHVLCLLLFLSACSATTIETNTTSDAITIGAILPLSGPGAVWGDTIQNGMELARVDLAAQGINLEILYEDSQANSQVGLSAYQKLVEQEDVDVVVSAFSRVGVPLIAKADQDEVPLIATVAAATGMADASPYVYRYFGDSEAYVAPHVDYLNSVERLGIISVDDEYGESMRETILSVVGDDVEVVIDEQFVSATTDFRTQWLKVVDTDAQAVVFISALPVEAINGYAQLRELNDDIVFVETSTTLSLPSVKNNLNLTSVHTTWFEFMQGAKEFKSRYETAYSEEPWFAAGFGYDIIDLIGMATQGSVSSGSEIVNQINALGYHEGLNGRVTIQENGDIIPETYEHRID